MGGECYANWTSLQRQLCSLLVLLFFYGLGTKYGRISAYCMNIRKRLYFAHLGLHDLSSFCVRAFVRCVACITHVLTARAFCRWQSSLLKSWLTPEKKKHP